MVLESLVWGKWHGPSSVNPQIFSEILEFCEVDIVQTDLENFRSGKGNFSHFQNSTRCEEGCQWRTFSSNDIWPRSASSAFSWFRRLEYTLFSSKWLQIRIHLGSLDLHRSSFFLVIFCTSLLLVKDRLLLSLLFQVKTFLLLESFPLDFLFGSHELHLDWFQCFLSEPLSFLENLEVVTYEHEVLCVGLHESECKNKVTNSTL